jgi:hypothetical protein
LDVEDGKLENSVSSCIEKDAPENSLLLDFNPKDGLFEKLLASEIEECAVNSPFSFGKENEGIEKLSFAAEKELLINSLLGFAGRCFEIGVVCVTSLLYAILGEKTLRPPANIITNAQHMSFRLSIESLTSDESIPYGKQIYQVRNSN